MAPGKLVVEGQFLEATIADLKARGHHVVIGPDWSEGRLCAVSQENGLLKAGSNARGMQGYAVGR
jgi:gamma-glutamyltranspeptidase/glutathione hydrolase